MRLFSDGADFDGIVKASKNPNITGFTTNPTLMRKAGVTNYLEFAENTIKFLARNRPDTCLSLEVFTDELDEMFDQAQKIAELGTKYNYMVYVKIPVTNTKGEDTSDIVISCLLIHIHVNMTAIFTLDQVKNIVKKVSDNEYIPYNFRLILSIFAGRIADAGKDPEALLLDIDNYFNSHGYMVDEPGSPGIDILWASTREPFNYIQAKRSNCDIITMTPEQIEKMESTFGKDLEQFSLETVQMFYNDAQKTGYTL
jgi:transaldolase